MGLILVTPAAALAVSATAAGVFCRAEGLADVPLFESLIAGAIGHIEEMTGRCLAPQVWKLTLAGLDPVVLLPKGPVTDVTVVHYFDANGQQQTLDPALYQKDLASDPQQLLIKADAVLPALLDGPNAVQVTFTAGYVVLPDALRLAVLHLVAQWYDDPGAAVPAIVDRLVANHRSFAA